MPIEKLDLAQLSRKVIDTTSTVIVYLTITALISGQTGEGELYIYFRLLNTNSYYIRSFTSVGWNQSSSSFCGS